MAITRSDRNITWDSGSSSKTVSSSTRVDSDAMTFDATDIKGCIQFKADNQGTPASGDICDVYIKWTTDGTTYDTGEHAEGPYRLDTVAANTPGENPAVVTLPIEPGRYKGYKLSVSCPQAGSRNILVSAREQTQRLA
jgi:hypothetical protein